MKNYKFDPSNTNPDNVVVKERHTIQPPTNSDFYIVIPRYAPFFGLEKDLTIRLLPEGRILERGKDYVPSNQFIAGTRSTGMGLYGSITILNHTVSGVLEITYHTIGGIWVFDERSILDYLSNMLTDPRVTSWDSVLQQPAEFPPTRHDFDIDDLKGWETVNPKLEAIREAIDAKGAGKLEEHMRDESNPHKVTKAQVGLGSVQNYGMATEADTKAGTTNAKYMSPLRSKQMIMNLVGDNYNEHASNTANPHKVTKAQVGLGSVQNYGISTETEARAGTSNVKYMTPLQTSNALKQYTTDTLEPHLNDNTNPHGVTKAQVGLSNVQNYHIATLADTNAGTSNNAYMTPLRTANMINSRAVVPLEVHTNDTTNPHGVTKAQVGLGVVENYPIATQAEANNGKATDKYITPALLGGALANYSNTVLKSHLDDTTNPHAVTKAQVGLGSVQNYPIATNDIMDKGTSSQHYITPQLLTTYLNKTIVSDLNEHESNRNNPHRVTKTHVGLGNVDNFKTASEDEAKAMSSQDTFVTPFLLRLAMQEFLTGGSGGGGGIIGGDHITDLNNPHRVTAAQVGAYTKQEMDIHLSRKLGTEERAADTTLAYGMTQEQLTAAIAGNIDIDVLAQITPAQMDQLQETILRGKADEAIDSDRLGGKTLDEVLDLASVDIAPTPTILECSALELDGDHSHYFRIGEVEEGGGIPEVTLLVSGGVNNNGTNAKKPALTLLRIDFHDGLAIRGVGTLTSLTNFLPDIEIYLVERMDEQIVDGIELWGKMKTGFSPVTFTNLTPTWFSLQGKYDSPESVDDLALRVPEKDEEDLKLVSKLIPYTKMNFGELAEMNKKDVVLTGGKSGSTDKLAKPVNVSISGAIKAAANGWSGNTNLVLDATVTKEMTTAAGAVTQNPNDATAPWIVTKHANCPDATRSWYIETIYQVGKNCIQKAYSTTPSNNMVDSYVRLLVNEFWSPWKPTGIHQIDPDTLPPGSVISNPIALGNTDLNTVLEPGYYNQISSHAATLELNYPDKYAGNLIVRYNGAFGPSTAGITQIYRVHASTKGNEEWARTTSNGSKWSAWVRTLNEKNTGDIVFSSKSDFLPARGKALSATTADKATLADKATTATNADKAKLADKATALANPPTVNGAAPINNNYEIRLGIITVNGSNITGAPVDDVKLTKLDSYNNHMVYIASGEHTLNLTNASKVGNKFDVIGNFKVVKGTGIKVLTPRGEVEFTKPEDPFTPITFIYLGNNTWYLAGNLEYL